MKSSRTRKCIELLASAAQPVDDASAAQACGLSVEYVRRLRSSPQCIAEINRRARQLFLARMPQVLAALADAAAQGSNASAMKLYIDASRSFETGPDDHPAEELLQRAHDAGIDIEL